MQAQLSNETASHKTRLGCAALAVGTSYHEETLSDSTMLIHLGHPYYAARGFH